MTIIFENVYWTKLFKDFVLMTPGVTDWNKFNEIVGTNIKKAVYEFIQSNKITFYPSNFKQFYM